MSEQQLQTYLPFHQKEFWEDFYTKKCTKGETINWYFDITKLDIPEFSIKNLSQQEKELYEKLSKLREFNPRKDG